MIGPEQSHRNRAVNGTTKHQRRPAREFYWSVLDPRKSGLGARPTVEQLGYLFENDLPCPIDDIHAEYVAIKSDDGDARMLACGCPRNTVEQVQETGALTFGPDAMPLFVEALLEPERLNLLTREFEPKVVWTFRRRLQFITVTAFLLLAPLIALGLERRTNLLQLEAAQLHDARHGLYAEVLGTASISSQPPELRLLAELRELRQSRRDVPSTSADDATMALSSLLRHWPVGSKATEDQPLAMQTDRLTVTPTAITMAGHLPSTEDAQRFAAMLGSIEGWQFDQPQVTASRSEVQLDLRLRRSPRDPRNSRKEATP